MANPVPVENLVSFDYRNAQLEWADGRWQIRAGELWLKDFGKHEREAREAVRIIRDLRLTQHGTVGTPQAVMEYWLADGHAPEHAVRALRTTSLNPDTLKVEEFQGQWCVSHAGQILFNFGSHAEDARRALDIIRYHGFNEVGYIGQPLPAMIYFAVGRRGLSQSQSSITPSPISPEHIPATSFSTDQAKASRLTWQVRNRPEGVSAITPAMLPHGRQLAIPTTNSSNSQVAEDRVPLDWRQVQVRRDKLGWKLVHGTYELADFGANEWDARRALEVVQHYRFTERCLVGSPTPFFSYFLVNGRAPWGLQFGTYGTPFRPEMLDVQRRGAVFVIADGDQILLSVGQREEDAQQVLKLIRQNKFDHLCRIGSSGRSALTFLVRTH